MPVASHMIREPAPPQSTGICPCREQRLSALVAPALSRWGEDRLFCPAYPARTQAAPRTGTKQITLLCSYESSFTSNDLRPIDIHDVNAERIHLQSVFICGRIDRNSKNCLPPPNGDHAATRISHRLGPIHLIRVLRRRENSVHVYLNRFLVGALKRLIGSVEFC